MMLLSIPFAFFLIPETKGIPLESMDRLFAVKPVRRAHSTVLQEDMDREEGFRHAAEGAGLSVAKEKLERRESIWTKLYVKIGTYRTDGQIGSK